MAVRREDEAAVAEVVVSAVPLEAAVVVGEVAIVVEEVQFPFNQIIMHSKPNYFTDNLNND